MSVDGRLPTASARVAGRLRLRGVDAVYIATAVELGLPLVTWDVEKRERATRVVRVVVPEPG